MFSVQRGYSATKCAVNLAGACVLTVALAAPPFVAAQNPHVGSPASEAAAKKFVSSLMARMTLEEKLGQMSQSSWKDPDGIPNDDKARAGAVGSFLFVTDPVEINRLQHLAVDGSRLHIPLIFGFDVIHGFRTIYPVPLAMSASWDPSVAEHAQAMAAREASAAGINWTFAPMVDIARDARWGRIMEGAGEDPYLGSRMAEAQVRGFQGPVIGTPGHILACVKHFAAYGAAEGGRDYDASNVSDEQLWNVYFPPFHAAEQAGAGSFMTAYMDLNGVPASGNRFLLHDVLRGQWGFQGFVVSDWEAVKNLTTHGFSSGPQDAAVRAATAGVDMEMTSRTYLENLPAALKNGTVSIAVIDDAVRNVLMTKYRLGLFEHPYTAVEQPESAAELASQHEATRKSAEQTAVLLRNEGGILPLKRTPGSVAVIGPLADSKSDIMGSWSLAGYPADSVTVLEGLRNKLGASATVRTAKGVEIERGNPSIFDPLFPAPRATLLTEPEKEAEFKHAIDLVQSSDVTVLVLGESHNMSGENASRSTLTLPGRQQQLLEAAVATGLPVVLVLINGRPLDLSWASTHVPAILEAWYPGTEGGNAIANLLMGDANPGGKLPVSWPRSVGQEPLYYSRNLTQSPQYDDMRYWDGHVTPLYPFGFGLSYAKFQLGELALDATSMRSSGSLHASVQVENTSSVAGDEVIQLYTHQRAGSASRPSRELKGFVRVHLAPGEKRLVPLELHASDLAFWSPQTHSSSVEPGEFDVWVGTDSMATLHGTFTVTR
jgi:beta-glucosidase